MAKALSFLIGSGLSWVIIGAVIGLIERRKFTLLFFQIVSAVFGVLMSLTLGAVTGTGIFPRIPVSAQTWWAVSACCFFNGVFNYTMYVTMGHAMRSGPNAVVWAIIQSGLVYPFIMGWLVFGEQMNFYRGAGLLLIVASVFLYAASSRASGKAESGVAATGSIRQWIGPALLGMLFCGINQCCSTMPSFIENGKAFPSAYRVVVMGFGLLACCAVEYLIKFPLRRVRISFKPGELKTVFMCALAVMLISNTVSVLLTYPGIDLMETFGRGSLAYPVMVCSCIIGFFIYGISVLREKTNFIQLLGIIAGTAGIALGCLFR